MRHKLLQTLAAVSWATAITADVMGADDRIWVPLLGAAMVASWAAVQYYLVDRASRAAGAMAQAALSRPLYRDVTGPQIPVPPRPDAHASNGHTQPGRHGIHARD